MASVVPTASAAATPARRWPAIGVSCFGPVEPNPAADLFGYITTTPKPHWHMTDVVGALRAAADVPIGFDSDVNGAALGEYRWGAAQGLDTFVYITVGTGLGGGGMAGGRLLHGLMHPEMGHMLLRRDPGRGPVPRLLRLPRRLLGGAGLRPCDRGALGQIRRRLAARPSRLGPGGALPGARRAQHHPRPLAAAHHPRRRRHGPAAALPAHAPARCRSCSTAISRRKRFWRRSTPTSCRRAWAAAPVSSAPLPWRSKQHSSFLTRLP